MKEKKSVFLKGIFSDSNSIFFMVWIRRYKQKKLISKISVDSNFTFSSYAWLCVFHCSHRLLCWIKSRVRDFSVKIALISYWNDFSPTPLGKCASYKSALQICKKITFFKFWECPLFDISEHSFNIGLVAPLHTHFRTTTISLVFLFATMSGKEEKTMFLGHFRKI